MARSGTRNAGGLHLFPSPPNGFDPFAASKTDFVRFGLPLRPDPFAEPGLAALWDQRASRYRNYEHVEARPDITTATKKVGQNQALGPSPVEACGYSLFSASAPFTILLVTWTVPNLQFNPGPLAVVDHFRTFVSLGFLDVHVEMTVDATQNVSSKLWASSVGEINLAVRPGDVVSATLCLHTSPPGRAHYFLANETTSQTLNLAVDTGYPPAVTISAGIARSGDTSQPPFLHPLARFGAVYFDEILAYTTSGTRSLTSGEAITMVNQAGTALAKPVKLHDSAFKAIYAA